MDNKTLKSLAQGIGEHVREEVSRVEDQIAVIAEKLADIPAPIHGIDGKDGKDGESITGPQGEQGPPGPPGESIVGEKGEKGEKGDPGESIVGPQGEKGEPGPPGESIVGPQGEPGPQGESIVGEKGEKGDTGDTGADGLGVDTPLWEEGVYREGSVVQHNFGQHFRALRDTAENPNSEDWERVGSLGFRLAGAFKKDAEYAEGDLFVKDFGLFLFTKGEATCIAGRGPAGQKGKPGVAGKDGADGKDGSDGKPGSEIKSLDFNGTDLVMVTERDGEFKNLQVSLEPFLTTAAVVTKEAHAQQSKAVIEEAEETVRKLFGHLNAHIEDQQAVPIRFYRGLWHADTAYQVGDLVRYGSEDYLCHTANINVAPVSGLVRQENPSDYWYRVGGVSNNGGSSGGGGDGSGGPVSTDQVLTRQDIPLRDDRGRFKSSEKIPNLNTQLEVNRYFNSELELISDSLDALQEKGYDDTEIWAAINQLPVTVASEAPEIEKDGELWYDDDRLELFVSYQDGWISTTPLAARVEQGEALQAEILARVEAGEAKQATIESGAMMKGGPQTLTDDNWSIKDDDGNTYAMISDGEITMYHVAEPEAPKQVANREYVDTKIAKKGDTMQGSLAMAGHQITGLGTPKQRGHTVNKGYMDDTIAPLEAKINQLEGSIGEYHWNFDSTQNNARAGKFNAKTEEYQLTNLVSEVEYFEFSLTDSDDKNPDFARLLNGDVLRITGPAGERAEWYVRSGSDGSNGLLLMGDLISSTFDEFVDGVVYGATGLSQFDPSGLATIDYVDTQDSDLQTKIDGKVGKFGGTGNKMEGNFFMGGHYIAGLADPEGNDHAVNRRTMEASTVALSGENVVNTSWRLKSGNSTVLSAGTSGKIKIYHLAYPSDPEHAANVQYVNDEIAKVSGGSGAIARSGNESNPTLETGELYLDLSSKTLLIGT